MLSLRFGWPVQLVRAYVTSTEFNVYKVLLEAEEQHTLLTNAAIAGHQPKGWIARFRDHIHENFYQEKIPDNPTPQQISGMRHVIRSKAAWLGGLGVVVPPDDKSSNG